MPTIKFTKMHGLGNDFVVIDAITQSIPLDHLSIAALANRHTGIGFDQLLLIEKSLSNADFFCRIFNSDGTEAEQCGNGMRCVARFIYEKDLAVKKQLAIETQSGIVQTTLQDFDNIHVNMGHPTIEPSQEVSLSPNASPLKLTLISMGNPHAILNVPSVVSAPVQELGASLSTHPIFPHGINVGFMEIVNRQHVRLRTFERGAGETLACGTNSCAAVVAGIINHALDPKVRVALALGSLWIEWPDENSPLMMSGPADNVFEGTIKVSHVTS